VVIAVKWRQAQFRALMKATMLLFKALAFLAFWAMSKMMDRL
jgi:hypothetical protein